jgi:hypothetical protein
VQQRVGAGSGEQLEEWAERLLCAGSVDEVFG